ncbi:SPOSA6832_04987 [Sporobolomyces salmonicolor]|uniref:SPOSA6832_04987-mRNA-1:cds n=1 Tax=Sporidiobolus salmonicolor TaxID=5005 RepID=A0A0D6ETH6_SPOSA|nr:SPOSA6832_04987 [Sporobolomyces salmonicolor]
MSTPSPARPTPTAAELSELVDCFRYGDLAQGDFDDIRRFAETYGDEALLEVKDERGNTALHMAGGNGHAERPQPHTANLACDPTCTRMHPTSRPLIRDPGLTPPPSPCLHCAHAEIVAWLLPRLPASALTAQNSALSTPLHWVALNYHLEVLELLCPRLPVSAFSIANTHGKTAVQEAEEACEAFVVGEEDQETDKGRERVRREKVVGYLLGCMGLGVKKPTGGDEAKAEEEEPERERERDGEVKAQAETGEERETISRLAEQAERLKLEQEVKRGEP